MDAKRAAKIAVGTIAVPAGLLLLLYAVAAVMPTGLPQARERAAKELEIVALRTAPQKRRTLSLGRATKATPSLDAADLAGEARMDFYRACELARREFDPAAEPLTEQARASQYDTGVIRGREIFPVAAPIKPGSKAQDWVGSVDAEKCAGTLLQHMPYPAFAWNLSDPGLAKFLDRAEPVIYGDEWELPGFAENWPACSAQGDMADLDRAAQLVLLRAAARRDVERVAEYLPRCLEISHRTRLDRFGGLPRRADPRTTALTLLLTAGLVEVPDGLWEYAGRQIEAARVDDFEREAFRKACVLRRAEFMKSQLPNVPSDKESPLHFMGNGFLQRPLAAVMRPILRGRIDAYAASVLDADLARIGRSQRSLHLAINAADLSWPANLGNLGYLPMRAGETFPPEVQELHPDLPQSFMYLDNRALDWEAVAVAIIRYRHKHGRDPEGFEELADEFLPAEFASRSQSGWFLKVTREGTVLVRFTPDHSGIFGTALMRLMSGSNSSKPPSEDSMQAIRKGPDHLAAEAVVAYLAPAMDYPRRKLTGS